MDEIPRTSRQTTGISGTRSWAKSWPIKRRQTRLCTRILWSVKTGTRQGNRVSGRKLTSCKESSESGWATKRTHGSKTKRLSKFSKKNSTRTLHRSSPKQSSCKKIKAKTLSESLIRNLTKWKSALRSENLKRGTRLLNLKIEKTSWTTTWNWSPTLRRE